MQIYQGMQIRLHHPWSGNRQDQEMLLGLSTYKHTCNYSIEFSSYYLFQSSCGSWIEPQQDKMVNHIYPSLPRIAIVRLHHPRSRNSQSQETFLTLSAGKYTQKYDTEWSSHYPSQSPYDTGIDPQQHNMVMQFYQEMSQSDDTILGMYVFVYLFDLFLPRGVYSFNVGSLMLKCVE